MSQWNRQLALLVVLIVVFVWLIGRQLGPGLGGGAAAPGRTAGDGPGGEALGPVEIAELRLDALEHKPATYRPGRDPFRFGQQPQASAPQPEPVQAPPPRAPEPPKPDAPPPPPKPRPPAIQFVYLGSFGLPGREIAVFADGEEILNAFAGDVLQDEFVVRSIGFESADIGFVNFPDEPAKRLAVGG